MAQLRSVPLLALTSAVALACGHPEPAPRSGNGAGDEVTTNARVGAAAARPSPERDRQRQLGEVDFPVSCTEDAQRDFEGALALLHHMMYWQAREAFEAITEQDPDCAMAHWGIAMTIFHPLWPDEPTAEELQRGMAAVERAHELRAETERERAYVETAAAYYEDWQARDQAERLERFERASAELSRRLDDDPDAAAFYALSLLGTAPAEDPTYAHQRRAAAILSELHQRLPRHPGALHYGIHAHDFPPLAAEGIALADVYDAIAPDVPHALHMPSHLYVRVGQWEKAAEWNRRSAEAAARQPVDGARSMHYVHALDYMMYSYLQRMQDRRAAAILADLESQRRYQPHPATAYGVAALHARIPLEQKDWQRASELSTDAIAAELSWEQFPAALGVVTFTRGLGAARSGDEASAERALTALDAMAERLAEESREQSRLRYWHARAEVQRDTVAAWLAQARGDLPEARRRMMRAADREDAVGKHPTMPGFVLPARELLGDLLLEQGRAESALDAYRASLRDSPRRANSLHGAATAAEQLGDQRAALDYMVRLTAMAAEPELTRPILQQAQAYLDRAPQERTERHAAR